MMVALFVIMPLLTQSLPKVGTFAALAGVAFSMIPSLLFLQRGSRVLEEQPSTSSNASTGLNMIALLALTVALFTRLCETVFWAFNLQVAALSGYSTNDFGLILSLAMVLALAVPWVANYLAKRFGRIRLLIAVMIIKGGIQFLLCQGVQPIFAVLQVLLALMMAMSGLYILELLADVDPTGRMPALEIAAAMMAESLGPGFGGVFYSAFGLASVGVLALALAVATTIFAIALSKQLAQRKIDKVMDGAISASMQTLD